jgi:hypothetical protein
VPGSTAQSFLLHVQAPASLQTQVLQSSPAGREAPGVQGVEQVSLVQAQRRSLPQMQ